LGNIAEALPGSGAHRFLVLLKMRGPQSTGSIGKAMGITAEAARQQLARLAAERLVESSAEAKGVGRPAQVWSLTTAGHARFPDTHAEVTVQLIGSIRAQFGEAALGKLIDSRSAESRAAYAEQLLGPRGIAERVRRLAEARTREGYMAEAVRDGRDWLLIENHCPICVAATACQGFCRTELETFREVLGSKVSVEREEHIIQGDRRCVYRVSAKEKPGTKSKARETGRRKR
jgi:predicted ArsR family transcriptional regulator